MIESFKIYFFLSSDYKLFACASVLAVNKKINSIRGLTFRLLKATKIYLKGALIYAII